MNHGFAIQHCRIVAPERLSDRFLASGVFFQQENSSIDGQVFLAYVLEVSKPWFPSSKVLPSLLETLHAQHALISPKRDLGDQFELLLRALNQQLNAISEQGETDWIGNLNGLIMVASGDELHFSQTGRSPAYLLQKNRIRQITDDTAQEREPHPLKTFANLASGTLQADDYLLISNHELYNEISLDALRRVLNNASPALACQSIVKELKKDKNLAVSSIILKIVPKGSAESERSAEITEVILEDEMQSSFKKFQKKAMPWVQLGKKHSAALGQASLKAARTTGAAMKDTVAPAAATLLQKGSEQAAQIKGQVSTQIAERKQHKADKQAAADLPVVEIILPKAKREAPVMSKPAEQPSLIPDDEFALGSSVAIERGPRKPFFPTLIASARSWMQSPQHRRLAALSLAIVLIAFTILTAISRRQPQSADPATDKVAAKLQQASELQKKAVTAKKLNQNVEASREIKEGEAIINGLSDLTDAQKKQADAIWTDLTALADSLSGTTRLASPVSQSSFSTASQHLTASLPFFYGTNSTTAGLLQTGQGSTQATQQTIALPDTGDTIVSVTKSSETDTAAYVLTRKDKVYRVVQTGTTTSLRGIAPTSGDFAPGDAIASYNGNVYILDGKTGLLWKYTNTGTVYSKGVSIIDTSKYDIKKSLSLAIDGSIYILKQDGTLLKFTSGQQDTGFQMKDLPALSQPLIQPIQVVTNGNMDSIYVLDAGLSSGTRSTAKVLEFSKDGTFVRQYAFPADVLQVQAFDIDPNAKKLWILSGKQVSEFNL